MNFNQIRYFLAVADTLNFTSAAEACAVSQPALSKAVRNLEESLGANLFTRNAQGVVLTDFGRTMRVHFDRIDENRRKAMNAAKVAVKTTIERLNVGVMCTIGPRRFSQFLETVRERHPSLEITLHDVTSTVIPELLLSGSLDCVFCGKSVNHDQRFKAIPLFSENVVVAFAKGHRFAERDTVPLAEVAEEPYLDRLHCEFRDDFLNFTKGSGLELNVAVRSEREDWILELIRIGLGVGVIPETSIISDAVEYRAISDLTKLRSLELVMTSNGPVSSHMAKFCDAAASFSW